MKKFVAALFLILSGYQLHAGWFPPDTQFEAVDDISGGLFTNREPYKIPKTFSPNMRNILVDERFLQRRKGWTIAGSTLTMPGGGGITMLGEFVKDNGDRECIVSNSSVVATTRDFTSYTLLRSGWNTTGVPRMAQGRKKVLVTNGIDAPIAYDGNTVTVLDGSGGNANVPRGKYPAFYDDRFWMFNSTVNNSALHYSDYLTTASEIIDPLTDARAWPPFNQLNVGFGDGAAGSGLVVNNGQLMAHKYNNSVWTIFGNTLGNYYPRKTNAEVGTISGDSIGILDGMLYYLAKDGIWEEGPNGRRRITDNIRPDINNIISSLSKIVADSWDTTSDFQNKRTALAGTTVTANGTVQVLSELNLDRRLGTSPPTITFCGIGNSSTTFFVPISSAAIDPTNNFTMWISSLTTGFSRNLAADVTITFKKNSTGEIVSNTQTLPGAGAGDFTFNFNPTLFFTGQDVLTGNISMEVSCGCTPSGGFTVALSTPWTAGSLDMVARNSTGSYTAQVTTITTLTYWDQFSANSNTNGGTVQFYIKAATAAVNITTETWTPINSGSSINFPTAKNVFVWTATMTSNNPATPSEIDFVRVNHNEGSANATRPIAIPWNGRYLLFVSTTASGATSMGYWKARNTSKVPDAIMPVDGINIQSVGRYNENLYAGSSTAPIVLRLDNGTNDNGRAINSFFETAAFDFGNGFYEKSLSEYLLDMEGNGGGTIQVGTSVDGRAFTNRTATMSGTDRMLKHLYNVDKYGKYFRFRFDENDLDKDWFMHAFIVGYNSIQIK